MNLSDNVQNIYAAFGRGDIPAILERLAPDVEWEYGVESTNVPWLQPRCGRAEVAIRMPGPKTHQIIHDLQAFGALTAHLRRDIQWPCPELRFNPCALFS
jgi:ketosteroid isomerase-like protein